MTCLIFDIDGTLFDCGDIVAEAFIEGVFRAGRVMARRIEAPSKEQILSVIGLPAASIFRTLFPSFSEEEIKTIDYNCTAALAETIKNGGGSLFDGVQSVLKSLYEENYTMLIASNGRIEYIESILNNNGIMKYFKFPIITIDEKINTKTKIVEYYRENIAGNDLIIMIGDRESDSDAALENGIPFIGCVFGHGAAEELKDAGWVCRNFNDVYHKIKEVEASYVDSGKILF